LVALASLFSLACATSAVLLTYGSLGGIVIT
jgi:hypothetical protein